MSNFCIILPSSYILFMCKNAQDYSKIHIWLTAWENRLTGKTLAMWTGKQQVAAIRIRLLQDRCPPRMRPSHAKPPDVIAAVGGGYTSTPASLPGENQSPFADYSAAQTIIFRVTWIDVVSSLAASFLNDCGSLVTALCTR